MLSLCFCFVFSFWLPDFLPNEFPAFLFLRAGHSVRSLRTTDFRAIFAISPFKHSRSSFRAAVPASTFDRKSSLMIGCIGFFFADVSAHDYLHGASFYGLARTCSKNTCTWLDGFSEIRYGAKSGSLPAARTRRVSILSRSDGREERCVTQYK